MNNRRSRRNRENRRNSMKGMQRMKELHDMETAGIIEHVDAFAMEEHLADPKQSIPRPRSDLPKNRAHDSIHEL